MSLITRCPACGTAFRVQSSQLAAHSGTVRCGKCGGVFNGVAALVEESDERLAFEPSPQLGLFDPGRRSSAAAASGAASAPAPDFLAEPHDGRRSRWLWALAALLAAVAVGVQVTYRFRAELAASSPEASKALRTVCQPLGCDVPLPRRQWYVIRPAHGPVRPAVERFLSFVRSDEAKNAVEGGLTTPRAAAPPGPAPPRPGP